MESIPPARGEISGALIAALGRRPHALPAMPVGRTADPVADEDLQLALYLCYELHYRGLPGVSDAWEWEPSLLAFRATLEAPFERALRDAVPVPAAVDADEIDVALRAISELDGPSLSTYIRTRATVAQMREFMIHRSAYQLKEADPHSWAIPRLHGVAKAALIEVQADEYGGGRADWMHSALFARSMRAQGLDDGYGAYLPAIPGLTLATVNLMSLFGLHRRLRGAIVGHLALFEMTSSVPNRRYGDGLRRLGFGRDATLFFDEHVTADAVHENIAAVDLAGGLVRCEPELSRDVLWGAQSLQYVDARWATMVLDAWRQGAGSLLAEPAVASAPPLVRS
jgi:hypothetical protein